MPADDRLFELLRGCSDDELALVWEDDLDQNPDDLSDLSPQKRADAVSAEIRSVAGHTLDNLLSEKHALPWRSILTGVYDSLTDGLKNAPRPNHDTDVQDLERQVIVATDLRVKTAWERLSPEQRAELLAQMGEAAEFEERAIHDDPPPWRYLAEPGAAVGAFGLLWGWLGIFASPLIALGVPVVITRQVKQLMQPSFRKLVPAVLHLLHFNKVDSKATP